MLPEVYVALGSNLGDSKALLDAAINAMRSLSSHLYVSRFYRSKPLSPIPQPHFLNAVCQFQTALTPLDLFGELERIERSLGKTPKSKEAPRPIDLDLLFYGDVQLKTDRLEIPHPRWRERLFVLRPLADLVGIEHPVHKLLQGVFQGQEVEVLS